MQIHTLKREHPNKTSRRVGRGGARGKTSGRGMKGQKARAGHSIRPAARDIIKKLPKLRGHGKNRAKTVHDSRVRPVAVNIAALDAAFESGAAVTPKTLAAAGVVSRRRGAVPAVKLLGNGETKKAFSVSGCETSASAREKIEAAGGSIA